MLDLYSFRVVNLEEIFGSQGQLYASDLTDWNSARAQPLQTAMYTNAAYVQGGALTTSSRAENRTFSFCRGAICPKAQRFSSYRSAGSANQRATMVFTGIVEEMGRVTDIQNLQSPQGGVTLKVAAKTTTNGVSVGDSISVNGTCLTVTELGNPDGSFCFGLAPETLRCTNLGHVQIGSSVNLERSLASNGRFGGHVVQGHVDTTGKITAITRDKEALVFKIEIDRSFMKYVVPKGYIAVDGASLTVCDVKQCSFTFMMIEFTQAHVVTASKQIGDLVNIEVDIMGKYIEKLLEARQS